MSSEAKNGKYVLVTGGAGYIGSHTVFLHCRTIVDLLGR
jgi:UDP-glucose 4-epimerase